MTNDPTKRGTYPAFTDPPEGLIEEVARAAWNSIDQEPFWDELRENIRAHHCTMGRAAYAIIAHAARAAGRREGLEEAWNIFHAHHGEAGDQVRALLASTPTPEAPAFVNEDGSPDCGGGKHYPPCRHAPTPEALLAAQGKDSGV